MAKAKVNNPNTRSGKLKMPFSSLKRYQGGVKKFAKGGEAGADEVGELPRRRSESIGEERVRMMREDKPKSFSSEFAAARKAGKKVFDYNGKSFTTELKGEKAKPASAPASRPASSASRSPTPSAVPDVGRSTAMSERLNAARTGMTYRNDTGQKIGPPGYNLDKDRERAMEGVELARLGPAPYLAPFAGKGVGGVRGAMRPNSRTPPAPAPRRAPSTRAMRPNSDTPPAPAPRRAPSTRAMRPSQTRNEGEAAVAARQRIMDEGARLNERMANMGKRSGGSIKKYAKGGGAESKGKTRGRFV